MLNRKTLNEAFRIIDYAFNPKNYERYEREDDHWYIHVFQPMTEEQVSMWRSKSYACTALLSSFPLAAINLAAGGAVGALVSLGLSLKIGYIASTHCVKHVIPVLAGTLLIASVVSPFAAIGCTLIGANVGAYLGIKTATDIVNNISNKFANLSTNINSFFRRNSDREASACRPSSSSKRGIVFCE